MKKTGTSYEETFLYTDNQKKLMGESKEIKQNWTGPINFDSCFCLIFSWYGGSPVSRGVTRHYPLPLTNFEIFLLPLTNFEIFLIF